MAPTPTKPACQRCGHCCRTLILEVSTEEVEAIPILKQKAWPLDGNGKIPADKVTTWSLNHRTAPFTCVFLEGDSHCSIYGVRPQMCREFGPSDERCAMHDR